MSQRIEIEQVNKLAADFAENPMRAGFLSYEVAAQGFIDLRDAYARIAELERFSASQEEAHASRDRGVKL